MVNSIITEPDPESDLDPDIRNYSQQSSHNQVNGGTTSTAQPLESSPLSFVSEKPTLGLATQDGNINEKDYATPGTASTAIGSGTLETTLNPSPSRTVDQTSLYSQHLSDVDGEDDEPVFPFISWKTSAIVSRPRY